MDPEDRGALSLARWDVKFCEDLTILPESTSPMQLPELLLGFFHYYACCHTRQLKVSAGNVVFHIVLADSEQAELRLVVDIVGTSLILNLVT